jgi:hypothetical protein
MTKVREHLAASAISNRIGDLQGLMRTPSLQRYPRALAWSRPGQSAMPAPPAPHDLPARD